MVDPKVYIVWKSMKKMIKGFSTNRGDGITAGIKNRGSFPLLNYVKNSCTFVKCVIESTK